MRFLFFILFYFFILFIIYYLYFYLRRQKNIQRCGSFNVSAKVHYCVREKSFRAKLAFALLHHGCLKAVYSQVNLAISGLLSRKKLAFLSVKMVEVQHR